MPAEERPWCEKHKRYKGTRLKKERCPGCDKLYRAVQREIRSRFNPIRPYKSLTTPGERFGCTMFLAELSCVMLYGDLRPHFWRGSGRAARHFQQQVKKLQLWRMRDPTPFKTVDAVMFHVYTQHYKDELARRAKNRPRSTARNISRVHEDDADDVPVEGFLESLGIDRDDADRKDFGRRYKGRRR